MRGVEPISVDERYQLTFGSLALYITWEFIQPATSILISVGEEVGFLVVFSSFSLALPLTSNHAGLLLSGT